MLPSSGRPTRRRSICNEKCVETLGSNLPRGSNLGSLPFWGEISLFCETQVFRLFDQPPSPRIRFPKQASMSSTLRASTPMRTVSRSNRVPSPRKRGTRSLKQRKFLIDAAASRLSLSRRSLLSLGRRPEATLFDQFAHPIPPPPKLNLRSRRRAARSLSAPLSSRFVVVVSAWSREGRECGARRPDGPRRALLAELAFGLLSPDSTRAREAHRFRAVTGRFCLPSHCR